MKVSSPQGLAILEVGVCSPQNPPLHLKKSHEIWGGWASNNNWVDDFKFKMIDVETSGWNNQIFSTVGRPFVVGFSCMHLEKRDGTW